MPHGGRRYSKRPTGAIGTPKGATSPDASSPDAAPDDASTAGCPSGSEIQSLAAIGEACTSDGLYCPDPGCDPCAQTTCHAVTCTGGRWAQAVDTATCAEAGACVTIDPSSFDRSCESDSDCMGISAGTFCSGEPWCLCPGAAINVAGESQYKADRQALDALTPNGFCGCPFFGAPRCIAQVCTVCGGAHPCPDGG